MTRLHAPGCVRTSRVSAARSHCLDVRDHSYSRHTLRTSHALLLEPTDGRSSSERSSGTQSDEKSIAVANDSALQAFPRDAGVRDWALAARSALPPVHAPAQLASWPLTAAFPRTASGVRTSTG